MHRTPITSAIQAPTGRELSNMTRVGFATVPVERIWIQNTPTPHMPKVIQDLFKLPEQLISEKEVAQVSAILALKTVASGMTFESTVVFTQFTKVPDGEHEVYGIKPGQYAVSGYIGPDGWMFTGRYNPTTGLGELENYIPAAESVERAFKAIKDAAAIAP